MLVKNENFWALSKNTSSYSLEDGTQESALLKIFLGYFNALSFCKPWIKVITEPNGRLDDQGESIE